MQLKDLRNILEEYNLRNTSCRYDVLNLFMESDYALEPKDLESNLQKYDRVTLYRTLNTFIEKGIIHKIPSDNGNARYAVTAQETASKYNEEHIHFKCEKCERTECLKDYSVPKISLPKGYTASAINLIVSGKCHNCQN